MIISWVAVVSLRHWSRRFPKQHSVLLSRFELNSAGSRCVKDLVKYSNLCCLQFAAKPPMTSLPVTLLWSLWRTLRDESLAHYPEQITMMISHLQQNHVHV